MQVDRVLNDEQKEKFYSSPASQISNVLHRDEKNTVRPRRQRLGDMAT